MRINHNIAALNTYRQLNTASTAQSKSMEKLSSGLRINKAGDDAAGLAISEKMRGQIRGLDMASKNAQDGISMIQTAEGALNETHEILQRMRELAVQAGNDTNTTEDRGEIQKEINQLTSEINRIGNTTEFNTKKLVNGDLSSKKSVSDAVKTTTKQVLAKTQTITVGENPVSWTGDAQAKFDIKFAGKAENDFNWGSLDTTATNTLTIKKSGDQITVDFDGTDSGSKTLKIDAEALAFDADTGTYNYSNHGISFSLTQAQVSGWEDGDTATIDLTKVGADVTQSAVNTDSGVQSLNTTLKAGGTNAATITNFNVDGESNKLLDGVNNVKVEWDGADLKVSFMKDTTDVAVDTLSWDGTSPITFEGNGVKFTLDAKDAASLDGTFKLDTAEKNVEKTTTPAVTKDASAIFQIGANEGQSISVGIEDMRAKALGLTHEGTDEKLAVTDGTSSEVKEQALDVSTHEQATKAVTTIQKAIDKVSAERSKLGAFQNRLEHTINNLSTSSENLTAAESRVRDVDYALVA